MCRRQDGRSPQRGFEGSRRYRALAGSHFGFRDNIAEQGWGNMDRRTLLGRLAKAERHAAGGTQRITRQQSVIATLQYKGLDTRQALALLNANRRMQALSEANVKRLRGELGQFN